MVTSTLVTINYYVTGPRLLDPVTNVVTGDFVATRVDIYSSGLGSKDMAHHSNQDAWFRGLSFFQEHRKIELEFSRLQGVVKSSPCEGCRAKAANVVHLQFDETRCLCELCVSYEEFLKNPMTHRFYSECDECKNLIEDLRKIVRLGPLSVPGERADE